MLVKQKLQSIPEKIATNKFINELIGSACLKYKTKDNAKNDNAIKGTIIISNIINDLNMDVNRKL